MKNRNLYLGIFISLISVGGFLIYNLIPQFETTEFDQESIVQISEGSTTTSIQTNESTTTTTPSLENEGIIQIQQSELDILLENNTTENISEYFETYLLIGSDRRSENSSLARGFVQGQGEV